LGGNHHSIAPCSLSSVLSIVIIIPLRFYEHARTSQTDTKATKTARKEAEQEGAHVKGIGLEINEVRRSAIDRLIDRTQEGRQCKAVHSRPACLPLSIILKMSLLLRLCVFFGPAFNAVIVATLLLLE
jgi:hypothetical protein